MDTKRMSGASIIDQVREYLSSHYVIDLPSCQQVLERAVTQIDVLADQAYDTVTRTRRHLDPCWRVTR
jgi:hypothetical protein